MQITNLFDRHNGTTRNSRKQKGPTSLESDPCIHDYRDDL